MAGVDLQCAGIDPAWTLRRGADPAQLRGWQDTALRPQFLRRQPGVEFDFCLLSCTDFGVDGIVIGDLVKLNGMANPANNYGFEVTAVSGAGLTVRDPTAQLLSEGPTASAAVERHVSMAARGFGDKAGNNTCD